MGINTTYNASFHFAGFGIKGANLATEVFAKYMVSIRQTDFESGNNIETETDEGHTGGANLNMGKYRTSAESEPSFTDKLRFKEGLEDYFLLLLGTYYKNPDNPRFDFGTAEGVNHFYYLFPPVNAPEPPACTIYNGYAKTTDDARVFNNAMLNEMEVSMSNDEAPTIKLTFVSDYNNFNLANPTRNFAVKSLFIKPSQTNIYYGDVGLTLEELFTKKLGCFMEASFKVNNNYENVPCQDNEFGKSDKQRGERETDGSFKLPWNDKTRKLEPEYEGGTVQAHSVTEETLEKQIAFEFVGTKIGETDINYRLIVHFPLIDLTKAESPLSGSDAKDLTIEWEVIEKPDFSFMSVDLWTDLEELHIDDEGCDLDDLFYDDGSSESDPVPATYCVEFTVTDGTDPVEGATVSVGGSSANTDATGKATISGLSAGEINYTVTKEGFTSVSDSKSITGDDSVSVTLTSE